MDFPYFSEVNGVWVCSVAGVKMRTSSPWLFRLRLDSCLLIIWSWFGWRIVGFSMVYGLLPPSSSSIVWFCRFIAVGPRLVISIHSFVVSLPSGFGWISVIWSMGVGW